MKKREDGLVEESKEIGKAGQLFKRKRGKKSTRRIRRVKAEGRSRMRRKNGRDSAVGSRTDALGYVTCSGGT